MEMLEKDHLIESLVYDTYTRQESDGDHYPTFTTETKRTFFISEQLMPQFDTDGGVKYILTDSGIPSPFDNNKKLSMSDLKFYDEEEMIDFYISYYHIRETLKNMSAQDPKIEEYLDKKDKLVEAVEKLKMRQSDLRKYPEEGRKEIMAQYSQYHRFDYTKFITDDQYKEVVATSVKGQDAQRIRDKEEKASIDLQKKKQDDRQMKKKNRQIKIKEVKDTLMKPIVLAIENSRKRGRLNERIRNKDNFEITKN